jgi:P2-related tail formation protein
MPNVGTLTAIRDFITKVRHHKYIYEFDIKGFFNNVSIFRVIQQLRDRGMSESMISILYNMLKSAPANID